MVSKKLKIHKPAVRETINEWRETGFIVVSSKINGNKKNNYKAVFDRGSSWAFDTVISKKRYRKSGFKTEEEAFEALCKLKEELRIGQRKNITRDSD